MGDGIMNQSTLTLVVHPIHPVGVLVNEIPVGGTLLPVGVVNYLICVVVPEIEQFLGNYYKTPDWVGLNWSHCFGLGKVEGGPKVVTYKLIHTYGIGNDIGKGSTYAKVVTGFGDLRI